MNKKALSCQRSAISFVEPLRGAGLIDPSVPRDDRSTCRVIWLGSKEGIYNAVITSWI